MNLILEFIFEFILVWPWLRDNGSTQGNRQVFGCFLIVVLALGVLAAAFLLLK